MGRGLARNIVDAGHKLLALDSNSAMVDSLFELGVRKASGLRELAESCEVILTCLPSVKSIREVYLAPDGLIGLARKGSVLVDCSTSDPVLSREIAARLSPRGIDFLDAPMLRNPEAAWNGTLHLIVGGEASVVERVRSVLDAVAERVVLVGPVGAGDVLKLINNAVTISNTAILCEVFTVARAYGVDLTLLTDVLGSSMAGSKVLPTVSKRLIGNDHSSLFATDVVKKDITLYTNLAAAGELMCPLGDTVRDLMRLTSGAGYGAEHYSRLATLLESGNPKT